MTVRIVKMTFRPEEIENFKKVFEESKAKIRAFPGVQYLELLQDKNQSNIFFTYSHWDSDEDLEKYRHSDLFRAVWSQTKALFDQPAEAWSNHRNHQLR